MLLNTEYIHIYGLITIFSWHYNNTNAIDMNQDLDIAKVGLNWGYNGVKTES